MVAWGINDAGLVAGYLASSGFVWNPNDSSIVTLNVPGAISTAAYGINDSGVVVGRWLDSNNIAHGFIAEPTPEPSTLDLGSVGLVLVLLRFALSRRLNRLQPRAVRPIGSPEDGPSCPGSSRRLRSFNQFGRSAFRTCESDPHLLSKTDPGGL